MFGSSDDYHSAISGEDGFWLYKVGISGLATVMRLHDRSHPRFQLLPSVAGSKSVCIARKLEQFLQRPPIRLRAALVAANQNLYHHATLANTGGQGAGKPPGYPSVF